MQTRHHLKEFSERNLILRRIIKLCISSLGFSLLGSFGNLLFICLAECLVSNETGMSSEAEYGKICSF